MKSLKAKFTITWTIVICGVICLFSIIIYYVNVIGGQSHITPEVLYAIGQNNPRINAILSRSNEITNISTVSDLIKRDQTEKYAQTLLYLIPTTLLLSALVSYIFSTYLLKPIEDLAISLKFVGSSNISKRLPSIKSSTEVEFLNNSFNTMLDDVENMFNIQDQFIQDAAHELRTPISAIKTTLQVFDERKDKSIQDYQTLFTKVEKINDKLIKLNENLLFLNKSFKSKFTLEKISLSGLIEDTVESIIYLAEKKNISIKTELPENICSDVDSVKLSIAIKNLIENAIKYSNPAGEVLVKLSSTKKKVHINVIDHGIGISQADLPRIFDRFYRAENSFVNHEDGEGLGLSIVKKIIDAHHGDIIASSTPSDGTIFTITLSKSI